jgi:hypothetical protein
VSLIPVHVFRSQAPENTWKERGTWVSSGIQWNDEPYIETYSDGSNQERTFVQHTHFTERAKSLAAGIIILVI